MENASKALILAGAVLVAVLVVSFGVIIFNNWKDAAQNSNDIDETEKNAFNSKITPYLGSAIQGSQVNALLQYCLSNNITAKNEQTGRAITVTYPFVNESGTMERGTLDMTSTDFHKVETGSSEYYEVKAKYNKDGLIYEITITQ